MPDLVWAAAAVGLDLIAIVAVTMAGLAGCLYVAGVLWIALLGDGRHRK